MHQTPLHIFAAFMLIGVSGCVETDTGDATSINLLPEVAGGGSAEPNLAVAEDGTVILSWLEPDGDGVALRYSTLASGSWKDPKTLARSDDWFVNWADFPSVVPIDDDLWAAHWLARTPGGTFAYDVAIAISNDAGETWSDPIKPHTDNTLTEHGFVSLFPWQDGVGALWLDGRNMESGGAGHGHESSSDAGGMTLRSAVITPDGRLTEGQVADELVCDCCQTDVAMGPHGPIAVYRNRSSDEIRDVFVMSAIDGIWEPGKAVADDGWEIAGCPVNGPSIAARGDKVAVSWFTAAGNEPRVKVAFSNDGGGSFGEAVDVGAEHTLGRVGVLFLDDGDAVVSWLQDGQQGQADVRMRRISADGKAGSPIVIATTSAGRMSGFPQIADNGDEIVVAWTDADDNGTNVKTALLNKSSLDLD